MWEEFKGFWADWSQRQQQIVDLSREKDELVKSGLALDDPKVVALDAKAFDAARGTRDVFASAKKN